MRRLGTWVAVTMSGVIFLQGCTISHHGNKQSESEKQISEFNKRNAKYSANNNDGSEPDDSIRWVDRTKTSPLVLVAPHATNHHRRGRPKVADLYTGGITEMVADKLHASALTTTGKVSDWHDNWTTRDDKFTRVLKGLPDNAIVVELHGMDDSSSDEPVSVGTGDCPSPMTDDIVRRLSETHHGQVDIDSGFNAQASYTVTDFMQSGGIQRCRSRWTTRFGTLNRVGLQPQLRVYQRLSRKRWPIYRPCPLNRLVKKTHRSQILTRYVSLRKRNLHVRRIQQDRRLKQKTRRLNGRRRSHRDAHQTRRRRSLRVRAHQRTQTMMGSLEGAHPIRTRAASSGLTP